MHGPMNVKRKRTFGFYKLREIFLLADSLVAS